MKKRNFIIIVILLIMLGIGGKFIFTIYASEYDRSVSTSLPIVNNDDQILKVGTYNIKSMNYEDSTQLFQNEVLPLNLDVIVFQEVDKDAFRSGDIDMIEEMANVANFPYHHFYSTMWILDGYYGLGIISKYPIVEVKSSQMPNSILKEPRILSESVIQVGTQNIHIFNTHVTYEQNEFRQQQLNYIKEKVDGSENALLLGDFNSFGFNGSLTMDHMNSINSNQEFQTFKRFGSPDNIFYSSEFSLIDSNILESSFSDHNLLYASFQY